MRRFGSSVTLRYELNEESMLIESLSMDNRKLHIQEFVIARRNNENLVLTPVGKVLKTDDSTLKQEFQIGNTTITREFRIIEDFKDRKGSGFEILVKTEEERDFDLEWGLIFKKPDYVYGDDEFNSSIQIFLKNGRFTIQSENAKYLRIDEELGYTILLPLELEKQHDSFYYDFEKKIGLKCMYKRDHTSLKRTLKIYGYLSISRRDEPISDNSLILIDMNDWKSAIKAASYPTDIDNRNKNLLNYYVFHKRNVFPMIFTEEDSKESIQEFVNLGQALEIMCAEEISEKNVHLTQQPFLDCERLDPRFRWISINKKFRFSILLPDNAMLSSSLILLIRDLNILPLFKEDIIPHKLDTFREILLEDYILIFDNNLEQIEIDLLKEHGFKICKLNIGNIEKASLRIAKAYFVIYTLDSAVYYMKLFSQPNSPRGINKEGERISITDIITQEIDSLDVDIQELLHESSFSNLLRKTILNDFYSKTKELMSLIIGINSLVHKSSLNLEENKQISRLRRINIASTKIKSEDIISLVLYSLAYDSPTTFIREDNFTSISQNSIKRIFQSIKLNKSFRQNFESIGKQIGNSLVLSFVQSWSDFDYNLEYSSKIMKQLNFPLPYDKELISNRIESSKGVISVFLKKELPVELLLGEYLRNSFSFGRFFLDDSKLLRHQIRSSLMQPRRGNNLNLKSEIITVETNDYLLKQNEWLLKILSCHGFTTSHIGSIETKSLDKIFQNNDLIFLFIHGGEDGLYPDILNMNIVFNMNDIRDKKFYRGILILNSCETGQDYTGRRKGIPVTLSMYGFPLIIAPFQKVTMKTAAQFSQLFSSHLYSRVPLSQIVSIVKRQSNKKNKIRINGYFVFGNPYARIFNPSKMGNIETTNCVKEAFLSKSENQKNK